MADFKKWSNASLTTLQTCAHQFKLKYLDKDFRPSGLAAKRGIGLHQVAKEIHKRQMVIRGTWDGDDDPIVKEAPGSPESIVEAKDLAASAFDKAVRDGFVLNEREREEGPEKIKAEQKDACVDMAGFYAAEVAPPVVPVAVERKVTINPQDSDIVLTGYMDLIETDEGEIIRDLKSAEKAPFDKAADLSQQLTLYSLMRLSDVKKLPRASRLVHVTRTPKTHVVKLTVQETTRSIEDIKILIRRINKAVEAVKAGIFIPADPASPGSPCGWCPFNEGTCEFYRKRPTTNV